MQCGYTKVRGLNAQLATLISKAKAAPVIAATRLRRVAAPSAHGPVRMIPDAITTARRCGANDNTRFVWLRFGIRRTISRALTC